MLLRRWIAGPRISDAVRRARSLRARRLFVCIDYLGEHETDRKAVAENVQEYLRLVAAIRRARLEADISLKPSALGLAIGFPEARKNFSAILQAAERARVGVWIDMEGSRWLSETVELYLLLHRDYPDLAIAIQANLRASRRVLERLLRHGARVRLTKGAYTESARVAFGSWSEVNRNFVQLLAVLFRESPAFSIATHDRGMVLAALAMQKRFRRRIEFQVLLGVRESLRRELVQRRLPVRVYVPYGTKWRAYIRRRVRERGRAFLRGR